MENISVNDSKFNFFTEDGSKVVEKSKVKSRIQGRKTLANISNIPQGFRGLNQCHKSGPSSEALGKHLEQLQKEKAGLKKSLAEKNKVIALSGTEMRKLRVTLEKVKQQNLQLAQSNSQMLAELRSVKERQKALNHELGCKNGLIVAINLELEEKDITRMCQADDIVVSEPEETEVCTGAEGNDDKHYTNSIRQISKGLVHSNENIQDNEKGKSKRLQKRRQSTKFKFDEPKPTQESSLKINSIDDAAAAAADDDDDHDDGKMKVNDSNAGTSSSSSSKMEDKEGDSSEDYNKPQKQRKTSRSRPVREAAKKVQSYKETNLVVKMRRE